MPRVPMPRGGEASFKDTLKDAVHDSKLKSPRRKKEEHA